MTESTEPRALTAALAAPAFTPKAGTRAMHAAARHVERWAPEAGADRVRPLRNLGFVDRIIAPWLETAQRSPSLRMFSQYRAGEQPERSVAHASWLFPRPWYQDELDWMAASRLQTSQGEVVGAPNAPAMPQALYGYVAPSMASGSVSVPAYSPLVPIAAIHAAHAAHQAAPAQRASSGLRAVLHTMLQRASFSFAPTRLSSLAPELVTPPAPRAPFAPFADAAQHETTATEIAMQRAQLAEVQRVALAVAAREAFARESVARETGARETAARETAARETAARETAARDIAVRPTTPVAAATEIEARIAQRSAERQQEVAAARAAQQPQRLHDVARESAARDARAEALVTAASAPSSAPMPARAVAEGLRIPAEIAQAIAALPPALASTIVSAIEQQPERAAQAVSAFVDSLRTAEVLARTAAAGGSFESAAGPRIVMPAGLGGLVANIARAERSQVSAPRPTAPRALAATEAAKPAALQHVAWADRWLARFAGANPRSLDVIASASSDARPMALASLAAAAPASVFVAPAAGAAADAPVADAPVSASTPAITRFDDEAETPDEVFASIAAAARTARTRGVAPRTQTAPATPTPALPTGIERDTIADVLAHAAPAAPNAGLSAQLASSPFAPAFRHVLPLAAAPAFDVRALFSSGLAATYLAGFVASAPQGATGEPPAREAIGWEPSYVAPASELAAHTALLAPQAQLDDAPFAPSIARSMALAMALPMIGEVAAVAEPVGMVHAGGVTTPGASYAAPGMIADRAHAWSVAQERSAADLALDFVTPELVLAARVYGLGPAEAAQAARLALSGAGALSTMASTVDRTFVQALAIEAERRGTVEPVTAYPVEARAASATQGVPAQRVSAQRASEAAASSMPSSERPLAPSTAAFGVERRMPRGAFMWPAATVAALGLTAASPDNAEHAMPVAALELLAARAVAELGSYAALGERPATPAMSAESSVASAAASAQAGAASASAQAGAAAATELGDAEVFETAVAMVPTARRAKLEAVFVALGQSAAARDWSPAARAARALALAGRGDAMLSARERAAIAWDVLPVVAPVDAPVDASPMAEASRALGPASPPNASRTRSSVGLPAYVETRPGLAALSARAGEALGSFVAPAVATAPATATQPSREREVGAVLRAPTAAPEFVRPGRSAGRFGGGEVEIPAWFEAAARKMFEDKGGSSAGPASELSLADLTLITSAPATQIAASSRSMPGSAPPVPSPSQSSQPPQDSSIDTESLAVDVYRQILALMDAARARNGEPYL